MSEAVELRVCEDCALWSAGVVADVMSEERVAEIAAEIAAAYVWIDGPICDEAGEKCETFSTRPCELCGSTLAGARHAVAAELI